MQASLKNFTAYRGATYIYFIMSIFHLGVALLVWLAAQNQNFPSYTKAELIGYYVVLLFLDWFVNWSMFTQVANDIKDGNIQKDLIRPYSYFTSMFGMAAGFKLYTSVTFFIGTVLIYYLLTSTHMPVSIPSIPLAMLPFLILSIVIAILISFTFRFALALFAFWFTEVRFIDFFYMTVSPLLSGDILPLAFFPIAVQQVNVFLPFRYQLSFPVEMMFGKLNQGEIFLGLGISLCWLLFFYLLYKFLWSKGAKSYMAFGH